MKSKASRKKLSITGLIQGIGFRPFLFNLATKLALRGYAINTGQGVTVELEGQTAAISAFIAELQSSPPDRCQIESLSQTELAYCGYEEFELRDSNIGDKQSVFMSADLATCPACVDEIFDSTSRRYRYAFTSCSQCGPRYSIINALPYDRIRTVMNDFPLCTDCQKEYDSPADRRFHAQTIACTNCGPTVELWNNTGQIIATNIMAINQAAEAISNGAIIAMKGVGGFQLLSDATNKTSVDRLRLQKNRPEKPFAVMCSDIKQVKQIAEPSELEQQLLLSAAAPIVLLNKKPSCSQIVETVAPDNTRLGVMLPSSPLHHILLSYLTIPIVATSGNVSNEPICIDNQQALKRLASIADFFIVHNRPILRPVDDSIVQQVTDKTMILRSARGYAPLVITMPENQDQDITLAVGGHLKNSFAVQRGQHAIISQHNGDLDSLESVTGFQDNIADLSRLVGCQPTRVIHDKHPDYASSRYAETLDLPLTSVQHHHAHLLSCMVEHDVKQPLLGIIWDGTGLGNDGLLWGGEFFTLENEIISRIATLRDFPLPGGTTAIKEPRRSALGMLWQCMGDSLFEQTVLAPVSAFNPSERSIMQQILAKQINTPHCSSIGRLFDCVASLLDVCQISSFEGQAAMRVEQLISDQPTHDHYPLLWNETVTPRQFDWQPLLNKLIDDVNKQVTKSLIAEKFHNTLVEMAIDIAHQSGLKRVLLSGGSFQNRYLTENIIRRLSALDFDVFWQQKIPTNDGGLALGQLAITTMRNIDNVLSSTR